MYAKCLHCNCQLKNSVYNIYNMRLVITIERLPWHIIYFFIIHLCLMIVPLK